jgi:Trk K+ transport system NAD-binding subunit
MLEAVMTTMKDHTVLCGFGHVGFKIFSLLVRLGERVVVVANQEPERWPLNPSTRFELIIGDGRDDRNLLKANILDAKSIIVATNDDITNVSIALDAKRLNPGIRTVVRLFDQDLASFLEKAMDIDQALCSAALCMPLFAAAALGDRMRSSLEVDGMYYSIGEAHHVDDSDGTRCTLREWSMKGRKAVISVLRGEEVLPGPPDSLQLQDGDAITYLGAHPGRDPAWHRVRGEEKRGSFRERFSTVLLGVKEWWHDTPKALRTALSALTVVVLGSIAVFHFALGMSILDSVYFVVTIVSTTGFGDFNLMNAPVLVKIYGIFLMLCGAAVVATLFSIVSDLAMSTRFRDVLAKGCSGHRGHFILAGLGKIGLGVLRELVQNGERVVAIELNENTKYFESARSLAPVVLGNAKTEETLKKAGVAGAKAIIAVTDNDIANLSIGLRAQRLNPNVRTVLRIFDANLADKMRHSIKNQVVLSASSASSPTFVGASLMPGTLLGFEDHGYLMVLFRRRLEPRGSDPTVPKGLFDGEAFLLYRATHSTEFSVFGSYKNQPEEGEAIGVRWYRLKGDPPS